jgi:hypothetical protein
MSFECTAWNATYIALCGGDIALVRAGVPRMRSVPATPGGAPPRRPEPTVLIRHGG